jgi:hypothetical protein
VRPITSWRKSRVAAVTLAAATVVVTLVACGDSEEAQTLTFAISEESGESRLSGPRGAETGLADITLRNEGKGSGDLQLIWVEGDHSPEEVVDAFREVRAGKAFPEWFLVGGGVGTTQAGQTQTVTQVFKPGTYYAFNTEASRAIPHPDFVPETEVSGEASEETVDADETISAFEYGFEAEELPSGPTEVVFDNTGAQPHHLLASPLVGDATADDVERFFRTEKGKLPLEAKGSQSTAVVEGGESQVITLDLEPGRYVLYCFISDRTGGPPHVVKGMVDEVDVQ